MELRHIVATAAVPVLPALIDLYDNDAPVDVQELVTLTFRAIVAGLDHEHALRVHGMHTDVNQITLSTFLRELYNQICSILHTSFLLEEIKELDLLNMTTTRITFLVSV